MSTTWKALLGVIMVYLFGCFSGGISTSIFYHHKMLDFLRHPSVTASKALEKRLTGNLGLDATQKLQVDGYFLDNLRQRKELQAQIQPQVQELNQQTLQQISAILRPDQRELFEKNVERSKMRLRRGSPSLNSSGSALPATNSGADSPP